MKLAIDFGNTSAMVYYVETGELKPKKELELLEKAAALNNSEALYALGEIYRIRFPYYQITKNLDKALTYYLRAAKLNNCKAIVEAVFLLAMLEESRLDEAIPLLKQGAALNNCTSLELLLAMDLKLTNEETKQLSTKLSYLKAKEIEKLAYQRTPSSYLETLEVFRKKLTRMIEIKNGTPYVCQGEGLCSFASDNLADKEEGISNLTKVIENLEKRITTANKLKATKLKPIYDSINVLQKHCETNRPESKDFAKKLTDRLTDFVIYALGADVSQIELEAQYKDFQKEFNVILHSEDHNLGKHREEWKPIIANISFALTGIGLVAIIIKASIHAIAAYRNNLPFSVNNALFWYKTQAQKYVHKVQNISNKSDLDWNAEKNEISINF